MDELNLFDLPQKSSDDSDYSANRAVGCCGRYIACSAAGHCVNQNSETAASCLYIVNSGDLKKNPFHIGRGSAAAACRPCAGHQSSGQGARLCRKPPVC